MISDQPTSNKKYCAGIAAAEWSGKLSGGSDLIRAMQRWAGVTADGTYECGEFQTVSEEELIEEINKFVETDDEFIEYKEGEK